MTFETGSKDAVIAIDVGGTTLKGAVFLRSGVLVERRELATFSEGEDPIRGLIALIDHLMQAARRSCSSPSSIGIGSPGIVDAVHGQVVFAANLRWSNKPIRSLLEQRFRVPVYIDHDARVAALGELAARSGDAASQRDFVFIPLGTGVAAALVSDGQLVRGATSAAGEFGHMCVNPMGDACACGQRGCVEAYASASSVKTRYVAAGGNPGLSTAQIIAARTSDAVAERVWNEAIDALSGGIAALVSLMDPQLIVLGGGLSRARDALLAPVRDGVSRALTWRARPAIELSVLQHRAGLIGAGLLAFAGSGSCPQFASTADACLRESADLPLVQA